ncbi:GDP-fucose protein O-fucosyltransferase 2 [Schistosoma japonicum]|nr:GDP-fucose protein O-fucosyltransferase 2 [Schistosoma japonicum]
MKLFCAVLLILASISTVCIHSKRYLFYDVFYGEGFNLRRDVYIRVANTVRLSLFVPVMDLIDFQRSVLNSQSLHKSSSPLKIDLALQLVRGDFDANVEQYQNINNRKVYFCPNGIRELYRSNDSSLSTNPPMELFEGSSFTSHNGILPMTASAYDCVTGDLEPVHLAPFLIQLIRNSKQPITFSLNIYILRVYRTLYLGSAQSIIHGHWSEWSPEYWTVRRSITLANHLRDIGDHYRGAYLHSYDVSDRTVPPLIVEHLGPGSGWLRSKWPLSPAVGGPYIAVHWRRGDFVTTSTTTTTTTSTSNRSPDSVSAAQQILDAIKIFNQYEDRHIDTVYLATDTDKQELESLKSLLYPFQVFHFEPSESEWLSYGPGGLALIDQWICAHARYFFLSVFYFC